jgi:hypothetical protein
MNDVFSPFSLREDMENKEERLMRLYERSQKEPSEIRRASKEISLMAKR